MSELLHAKLSGLRFKQATTFLATGTSMAIAFVIATMGSAMLLDWLLDFPLILRALLLAGYLAGLGYILVKHAIYPLIYNADDETLALIVEKFHPPFASRLIASIQFSQPNAIPTGASATLVRMMIRETEAMAEPLDFASTIKMDKVLKFGGAATALVIVALACCTFAGETTWPLFERALLFNVPLPSKTHIEPITGDTAVGRGDNLNIQVKVSGWHPAHGTAQITYDSGGYQTIELNPTKDDPNVYAGVLSAVQDPFKYKVVVFDAHTPSFHVDVVPPPAVVSLTIDQTYPLYTGLGTQRRMPGDLLILMGSKLRIAVIASKLCRDVPDKDEAVTHIRMFGSGPKPTEFPVEVNRDNPKELDAYITPADDTTGFTVDLVDQRGVHSQDPATYRIDMIPDRPPQIRIYRPDRKEILVTTASNPVLGFTAEDDFGLGDIALHFKVGDGAVQTLPIPYTQTDATTGRRVRQLDNHFRWPLSTITAPAGATSLEGTVIEYWIECKDNKEPTANSTSTDHYTARVVTKAEKQAELMGQLDEFLPHISDLGEKERQSSQTLGTGIQGSATQPATTQH